MGWVAVKIMLIYAGFRGLVIFCGAGSDVSLGRYPKSGQFLETGFKHSL